QRFLSWSTLCVHTVAFFIRVYRMWRILIKHDDKMWHTGHQILFMSSLSLIPVVATWAVPHTGYFDEAANTCSTTTFSSIVVLGMDALGFLAICYLWFVCARQLKWVRKQFNEYETMKRTLLYMTITLASYGVIVVYLLADDLVLGRRVSVFYPLLTTYILLWGSIREPFMMKILGDDEYLWSYTKGFAQLPSPAQLKASLAEQLSVDQLRDEFRRYIKTKVAQELIDFYLDSLDREEVAGFFERQAATMRIVDQYIKEGARDQVNVSGACREKILATDVTAFDIFDEARAEVLAVMETNFRRDFVTTEGFRRILNASKQEQRELRLLRTGGMLPLGTPSPGSSSADKTPSWSASPHTAAATAAMRGEGRNKPVGSNDTPSTDSLRGLYVKSRSDPEGLAHSNNRGFGGGGREPAIVKLFESSHSTAAAWTGQFAGAASRAGQTHSNVNRLYRGGTGNWSSGGVPRVEIVEDSSAAAPARPGDPAVESATNLHRPQPTAAAAAATAAGTTDPQSEASVVPERNVTAQQLGLRLAALAAAAGAGPLVSDNAESGGGGGYGDLEVGVEGLDALSSWSTDESPDWVRFSDWIRNGSGPAEGEGAEGGGGASWMWDVDRGLSVSDGGSPETGRRRRSWGSGGSSWSKHSGREF
ncbi:unnamed protein product, partial [Ectocarpus sp. 12 AP-2014]